MLLVLTVSVQDIDSLHLPKEWLEHIQQYCAAFEKNPHPPIPIATFPPASDFVSSPIVFLMPTFILWAPIEQYPAKYYCPKCKETGIGLKPVRWQCSSNPQAAPRKIHGIDGPIILVGRVYKCTNGDDVLAYHPGLLAPVPIQEVIPFALWYRTGFSSDLLELVHSLVLVGVSFSAITETLQRNRYKVFFRMKRLYHSMHAHLNAPEMPFPSVTEYEQMLGTEMTPSRHSTANVYLQSFWKKEMLYINAMKGTRVKEGDGWLSCDHTFASVSELL